MSLFLTGTDTGVGKTFVAVAILRWLRGRGIRAVGMKPICCGDRDDAHQLLAASEEGAGLDEVNPVWLRSPVAPSVAADIERVEIDLPTICDAYRRLAEQFETVVVEGVGGWRVPIAPGTFVSDLAKRLELPVAIVARNRLGCINHVLLTVESVQRSGSDCAGVILNGADEAADLAQSTNFDELRRVLNGTVLAALERSVAGGLSLGLVELLTFSECGDVLKKLTHV